MHSVSSALKLKISFGRVGQKSQTDTYSIPYDDNDNQNVKLQHMPQSSFFGCLPS